MKTINVILLYNVEVHYAVKLNISTLIYSKKRYTNTFIRNLFYIFLLLTSTFNNMQL